MFVFADKHRDFYRQNLCSVAQGALEIVKVKDLDFSIYIIKMGFFGSF